ncbi:MAG: lipopolysaccharide kinase InaA family protein [Candidatus Binatia bacterium]
MRPPIGYTLLTDGACRAVIRDDLVSLLAPWLLAPRLEVPAGAEQLGAGRGAAHRIRLEGVPVAVLRLGRRGGLLGRFVRERYLDLRPRPWRELAVTLAARTRGAPVPEVLAARVEGWLAYRSAILTAEVPNARTAMDALRVAPAEAKAAIAAAAATAVARLHDAGVRHADLNLSNILIADGAGTIVDLDRARLVVGPLGAAARRRNLLRLCRSARKLDRPGRVIDDGTRRAFGAAYAALGGPACAS